MAGKNKHRREPFHSRDQAVVPPERGGGTVKVEIHGYRQNGRNVVTHYSCVYINHELFQGDNGRVLGYDDSHDYHHRHYLGTIEPVEFTSFEDTLERFLEEWPRIARELRELEP